MFNRTFLLFSLYFFIVFSLITVQWVWGVSLQVYVEPALRPIYSVYGSLRMVSLKSLRFLQSRQSLLQKITALRKKNRRLRSQLRELEPLRKENKHLRSQLNLPDRRGLNLEAAEVIQSNLFHWERTVRLNRGTNHGVEVGNVVLDFKSGQWVLRGKVQSVSRNHCTVIISTDPRFKVGLVMENHPDRHFVGQGRGQRGIRIRQIPAFLNLELGTRVYTTPISDLAPQDLLVGKIVSVNDSNKISSKGRQISVRVMPPTFEKPYSPLWIVLDND